MKNLEPLLPYLATAKILAPNYDFSPSDYESHPEYVEAHGQKYNINNELHRGPDFVENVDLLAIGCSVTHGIGLPLETTWPHRLTNLLGLSSYNNLSFPGGSMGLIIRQTFEYIHKYGKPKYLVALLPDMDRIDVFSGDSEKIYEYTNRIKVQKKLSDLSLSGVIAKDNFLDAANQSVDVRYSRYLAMSSFVQLARLCELLEINFVWATWDNWDDFLRSNHKIDKYIRKTYEKVTDIRQNDLIRFSCHEDKNDPCFDVGTDEIKHWGSHYHLHIAERLAHAVGYKYGAKS